MTVQRQEEEVLQKRKEVKEAMKKTKSRKAVGLTISNLGLALFGSAWFGVVNTTVQ